METHGFGEVTVQVISVPSADDMDDATFARHMGLRHDDSLGGLPELIPYAATIPAWRAFHRRLHALAVDGRYEHSHLLSKVTHR